MGGSFSAPAPPDEVVSLFSEEELRDLRACFESLATPSVGIRLPALQALAPGLPWARLFALMASLEEPPTQAGPVTFRGFASAVARCCKARRTEREEALARLYADDPAELLPSAALRRLLSDSLSAARGGVPTDADAEACLEAAVADARSGLPAGAAMPVGEWRRWVSSQLPALPGALELYLLHYLCAVGRQAAAGGGGGGGGAPAVELGVRMAPVSEPNLVLGGSHDEGDALLQPSHAWMLGLAMGAAGAGEAREWRRLYASRSHGLSMNRFSHHAGGYAGPTLLIAIAAADAAGGADADEVFGAFIDAPLKPSDGYAGGSDCFLFTLRPTLHVYRPTGVAKNYVLYNPPTTGALRTETYLRGGSSAAAECVGFGGQAVRMRLSLEDDMNALRWHRSCTTYAAHPHPDASPADGARKLRAVELWGCGGADADRVQRELRERRARDAARAGKVDRAAMFGLGGADWRDEDNPDRLILESAGAHTFYSSTLEKLPQKEPGGATE